MTEPTGAVREAKGIEINHDFSVGHIEFVKMMCPVVCCGHLNWTAGKLSEEYIYVRVVYGLEVIMKK